jgi:hypothetical protein
VLTARQAKIQKLRLKQEKAVRLARKSLSAYIRLAWPQIDTADYVHNWHIDAIAEHLEAVTAGEIQYLLINIPPGMMKSLSVSVFWPSWEWIDHPELQYQRASHDKALSTRDNLKVRDLIKSAWWQESFGPLPLKKAADGKTHFENVFGGMQRATSPKSGNVGWRAHRLIFDDLLDSDDAHSDAIREAANIWFRKTYLNRRHDLKTDAVVGIAQRLHEMDVFGEIREQLAEFDWEWLVLPQRFDPKRKCVTSIGFEDPRTEQGELLFPARVDEDVDRKNKIMLGEDGYAGQEQQDPVSPDAQILHVKYIQHYKATPERIATHCDKLVLSVDCTFKDKKDSDFVCIQAWAITGPNFYFLDEVMERLDLTATIEAIRGLYYKWAAISKNGIHATIVEGAANGYEVVNVLKKELPRVLEITVSKNKEARAHAAAPTFDAEQVWFPDPSLGVEYVDPQKPGQTIGVHDKKVRYGKFPRIANDDDIDASTQLINWWTSQHGKGSFGFAVSGG